LEKVEEIKISNQFLDNLCEHPSILKTEH